MNFRRRKSKPKIKHGLQAGKMLKRPERKLGKRSAVRRTEDASKEKKE